jgi:proteasome lid subunit RPN8/RPN11
VEEIEITIIEEDLPLKAPSLEKGQYQVWGKPASADVRVMCTQEVIEATEEHAERTPNQEVGGILLGEAYRHKGAIYIRVEKYVPARNRLGQQGSSYFNFSEETWTELLRIKDQRYDQLKMVGWFHSHPGHGIFLSEGMDTEIHRNHFGYPWQTAMVFDPIQHKGGFFIWRASGIEKAPGFYELFAPDRQRSIVQWRNISRGRKHTSILGSAKQLTWVSLAIVVVAYLMSFLLAIGFLFRTIRIGRKADRLEPMVYSLETAVAKYGGKLGRLEEGLGKMTTTQATQGLAMATLQSQSMTVESLTSGSLTAVPQSTSVPTVENVNPSPTSTPTQVPPTAVPPPTTETVPGQGTSIPEAQVDKPLYQVELASPLYVATAPSESGVPHQVATGAAVTVCVPLTITGAVTTPVEIWIRFESDGDRYTAITTQSREVDPSDEQSTECFASSLNLVGTWIGHAYFRDPSDGAEKVISNESDTDPGQEDAVIIEVVEG